jgi:uronate dehydrogenase
MSDSPAPPLSPRPRVLLTGPGGRIGPHLLAPLRERFDLRLLDKDPLPDEPDMVVADLSDAAVLESAMQGCDAVIHLAATSDEAPFIEELVPNNVVGVYNVFEAARRAGVKRIVFASTVQTVARYPREHTVEVTDPVRPVSLYGATKVMGEVMGRWYHDTHGLEFVGVRIAWFMPADAPMLRWHQEAREHWLSPRDCAQLLSRAVETPGVGYALVFATSKTPRERLSLKTAREILGYEPQDDTSTIPLEPAPEWAR